MPFDTQFEASSHLGVPPSYLSVSDIVRASWASQFSPTLSSSPSECSEALSEYSLKSSTRKYLQNRGRISSRTQRRLNNDTFKDNPLAVLNPKDLPPPGFDLSIPSFHFCQRYMDTKFFAAPKPNFLALKNKRPVIGNWLRKRLRAVPITRKILPNLEASLRDFLDSFMPFVEKVCASDEQNSEFNELVADESWDKLATELYLNIREDYESELDAVLVSSSRIETHTYDESTQVLVCSLANSFHRFVLHSLCNYYRIYSFGRDDPRGYRSVVICQPGFNPSEGLDKNLDWEYPDKTFFKFLFES